MSSTLSDGEVDIFRDLLMISAIRGTQGSGVIQASKVSTGPGQFADNMRVRSVRTKNISGWLAHQCEVFNTMLKDKPSVLIGHARWPTKGGLDKSMVHPHRAGHIIGVHNGTLWKVNDKIIPDGASDSKTLYEHIAEVGIEEAWAKKEGAAALVWVDEAAQTINFIRNNQRPLFCRNVGWDKNITTMYFASTREILDFSVGRLHRGNNTWDTFFPENKLYTYPLKPEFRIGAKITDLTPKTVVGYTGNRSRFQSYGWWNDFGDEDYGTVQETKEVTQTTTKGTSVVPFSPVRSPAVQSDVAANNSAQREAQLSNSGRQVLAVKNKNLAKQTHYTDSKGEVRPIPDGFRLYWDLPTRKPVLRKIRVVDLFPDNEDLPFDKDPPKEVIHVSPAIRTVAIEGFPCVFCGDSFTCGERVYDIGPADTGRRQYICMPCSTRTEAKMLVPSNPQVYNVGM